MQRKLPLQTLRLLDQRLLPDRPFQQRRQNRLLRRLLQKPERAQVVNNCHRLADAPQPR